MHIIAKKMHAAVLCSPGKFELRTIDKPNIGPTQVRVRMEGCGICGSNLAPWEGRSWFHYPFETGAPGHEGWGEVEAIGDEVGSVKAGDRVSVLSYHAFAECDVAEATNVVPLPQSLKKKPFPGEALGCAFNVFRRAQIRKGQTVAVIGIGFLGAVLTALARNAGARVIAISRRSFALQIAKRMGANEALAINSGASEEVKRLTSDRMCDCVIEAAGTQETLDLATDLTCERGRLIIAGYHQDEPRKVNMQVWNWRGIDVINAHERDPKIYIEGMREAVEAVASGRLDPSSLYTHTFSFGEIGQAFTSMQQRPDNFLKSFGEIMIAVDEPISKPRVDEQVAWRKPRLGFLGVGWIGRHRMEAVARSGCAEVAAIADPAMELVKQAVDVCGQYDGDEPVRGSSLDELFDAELDGVVIATPSALHAEQTIAALDKGLAVFCQKPLARTGNETRRAIEAARANDCLLGVDLSYRYLAGVNRIRDLLHEQALGTIFAVELAFHNAYGPDKAWFYERKLSGGGCVIDLGIHLVDLALWALDFPKVSRVTSRLFQNGKPLKEGIEDYASARLDLSTGTTVQMACSWKLPAGCDAIISASFYGSKGGATLRNVNGSFYDFVAEHCVGTHRASLAGPPDDWQGRAVVDWAQRLARGAKYDGEIDHLVEVARTLDHIYACDGGLTA